MQVERKGCSRKKLGREDDSSQTKEQKKQTGKYRTSEWKCSWCEPVIYAYA